MVNHRDAIGKLVGLLEVLRGQQHRCPLMDEPSDRAPDLIAAARVQPSSGLVKEEHPGATDQARCKVEPSSHPARVGPGRPIGGVREIEAIKQLPCLLARLARWEVKEPPEHLQVLLARQQLVHRGRLTGQADELSHCAWLMDDIPPEDEYPTGVRPQ